MSNMSRGCQTYVKNIWNKAKLSKGFKGMSHRCQEMSKRCKYIDEISQRRWIDVKIRQKHVKMVLKYVE